jgi:fibronectin type 3 domain-containing protein
VALSWSAPGSNGGATITNYKVYRSTSSGTETLLTTVGNVTSWTDSGAVNGTTYFYKISAVNSVGEGGQSNELSATPSAPLTVPGAPTLSSASPGNNSVALSWSAPGSNGGATITNYKVYRGTATGGETLLTTVGNVTSFTDTSAVNGTTYFYKVSAVNSVGEGGLSNELSATPSAPATVPGAPTMSSATPGNGSVALKWNAPGSSGGAAITAYKVYRSTSSGSETLLTTLGNVTSFTDTSAVNGIKYFYKVSAVNSAGEGAASSELSATPAKPKGKGH